QRHARGRTIAPPGEQSRPAAEAKHPIKPLGGGKARRLALDRERILVEQRAGKEGRAHRLLAIAAMADANIDRLPLRLEADGAAQATTFSCHPASCYPAIAGGRRWIAPDHTAHMTRGGTRDAL